MENGVSADEDENPDAHSEGSEHLHPLRVPMLFQEPRQSAPCLLGGRGCEQKALDLSNFSPVVQRQTKRGGVTYPERC